MGLHGGGQRRPMEVREPYVAEDTESTGPLRIALLLASNPEMLRTYQPSAVALWPPWHCANQVHTKHS